MQISVMETPASYLNPQPNTLDGAKAISSELDRMNRKKVLGIALVAALFHFAIWIYYIVSKDMEATALERWDAGWYSNIATNGYVPQSAAFYPLYPFLVWGIKSVTMLQPLWAGMFLSTLCYFIFWSFVPVTNPMALFLLAFSPASYIFQTHHSEALFLLLSFSAFFCLEKKYLLGAALLAGLCALCKNQGVFLAIAIACSAGSLKKFVQIGAVSFGLWMLMPLYFWHALGDPFAFLTAQTNWTHAHDVSEVLKGFLLQNPWQDHSSGSIARLLCYLGAVALLPTIWKKSRSFGIYCLLSLLVMPLQGEFVTVFRFFSFLFPLYFALSDLLTKRWQQAIVVTLFVVGNGVCTAAFVLGRWAY